MKVAASVPGVVSSTLRGGATSSAPCFPVWYALACPEAPDGCRVPMMNLAQPFELDTTRPMVFYRAEEFFADPPPLQLGGSGNLVLLLYGQLGTNYVIQMKTNVVRGANWIPLDKFAPTDSFQFIDAGRLTNRAQFFWILGP